MSDQVGNKNVGFLMKRLIYSFLDCTNIYVISTTLISPSFQMDRSGQTVKTQIRMLLEVQSDLGFHCLHFGIHPLMALLCNKTSLLRFKNNKFWASQIFRKLIAWLGLVQHSFCMLYLKVALDTHYLTFNYGVIFNSHREKTGFLHTRKQRHRSALQ